MSVWNLQQKKTRGNFRILDTASEGRRDTKPKTKQPLQPRRGTMWTYGQIKSGVTDTFLGVTFTAAVPVGAVLVTRERLLARTSQEQS